MELPGYNNLTCYQAQLKMSLYIENDPYLTDEEHEAFEAHLESCAECAREYEESRFVISLVKRYWTVGEDTLALIEKANQRTKPQMTVEEGWEDLKRRIPELVQLEKRRKRLRLFRRVGAIAACLAIGISIFVAFSYSKPEIAHESIPEQAIFAPKPSVKVELVSDDGKLLIPPGHKIAAAKELKILIINDKHRMVMNAGTSLSIDPFDQHGRFGCIVKLASGEIFTHVEHDGNPFVVDTVRGKAVIIGTTFDVKLTDDSTILVVSEGTVQFESESGVVRVAASQTSKIVGQSAPSRPVLCNTAELTAWVAGYQSKPALAQAESSIDPSELPISLRKGPIVLEETDYDRWIEQKRNWFKQNFPWIFQLKSAFAKEGIEVDYPELLIETGDVWQFICFDRAPARFSVVDPNSLINVASDYGFSKQWLLENVPIAKSVLEKPVLSVNRFVGLKAFERWLKYFDEAEEFEPPPPIYSYHASKYLAETRSLIWFVVRDGQYSLTDETRVEVLDLLQEEVMAACKYQNEVLYPDGKPKLFCCEDKRQDEIELVSIIYKLEKKSVEYISIFPSTTR